MKKILEKVNQTGTMLVEAMAMLGLIAMVTPILYKKAAERTTELQDINAANQLRVMSNAMDAYIKDNFAEIARGGIVYQEGCPVDEVDYDKFKTNPNTQSIVFPMTHLCGYLPYGFISGGAVQETKMFSNNSPSYQVILKLEQSTETDSEGNEKVIAQTVTGFLTAVPKDADSITPTRASRIATMVGSNGGVVESPGGQAMGAQGIWSVADTNAELGNLNLPTRTFLVSSLQPISSQGLANEDVLHRKSEPDNNDILNTMETDLYMGFHAENAEGGPNNIRLVNQIILTPNVERMVGHPDDVRRKGLPETSKYSTYETDLKNTLYISKGGGAYIEGVLNAMDSVFRVDDEGISYFGVNEGEDDGMGGTTDPTLGDKIFNVTSKSLEYGNIVGKEDAGDKTNLLFSVESSGTLMYATPSTSTPSATPGGEPSISYNVMALFADRDRMSAGNHIFQVTSAEGSVNTEDTKWSTQPAEVWKTVIGGGKPYKGAYSEYTYTLGYPEENTAELATKEFGLTVNAPVFIKDTLLTSKLKAWDVDAATLRGGVEDSEFDAAKEDQDFYMVTKPDSFIISNSRTDEVEVGGIPTPVTSGEDKLIIAEEGNTDNFAPGVMMQHNSGVDIMSGDVATVMVAYDASKDSYVSYKSSGTVIEKNAFAPQDDSVRLGAEKEVSLNAFGYANASGNKRPSSGVVSIQGDILRAFYEGNTNATLDTEVTDFNIVRQRIITGGATTLSYDPYVVDYFAREEYDSDARTMLGDVGLVLQTVESGTVRKGKPYVEFYPDLGNKILTSRFTGGFAIFDHDYKHENTPEPAPGGPTPVKPAENPALYVSKGTFEIRATKENTTADLLVGDVVLQVDNNSDTSIIADDDDRGTVYIRKGAINIETVDKKEGKTLTLTAGKDADGNDIERKRLTNHNIGLAYRADAQKVGYVSADRFVAHIRPNVNALNATNRSTDMGYGNGTSDGSTVKGYDFYEVNPAYTSVMHDIKLTTRGGARLSDILPDFINKGIYIVNNSYKTSANWTATGWSETSAVEETGSSDSEVSAWTGFVPTPQCPPGYSKVITLNPSSWAMAQAGTPGVYFNTKGKTAGTTSQEIRERDINPHNNPYLYYYSDVENGIKRAQEEEPVPVTPLTFQKNTWLKAMVVPKCTRFDWYGTECTDSNLKNFTGWGTVMGFIYPKKHYEDLLKYSKLGKISSPNKVVSNPDGSESEEGVGESDLVYWNLFPVYKQQLEAYATVYCYFERKNWQKGGFYGNEASNQGAEDFVDVNYNQMGKFREFHNKADNRKGGASTNYKRLNDPSLIYNDPW